MKKMFLALIVLFLTMSLHVNAFAAGLIINPGMSETNTNRVGISVSLPEDFLVINTNNLSVLIQSGDTVYQMDVLVDNQYTGTYYVPDGTYKVLDCYFYDDISESTYRFNRTSPETLELKEHGSGDISFTIEDFSGWEAKIAAAKEPWEEKEEASQTEESKTSDGVKHDGSPLDDNPSSSDSSDPLNFDRPNNEQSTNSSFTDDEANQGRIYPWRRVVGDGKVYFDGVATKAIEEVTVRIAHGGPKSEATFKISLDGEDYSEELPCAEDYLIPDTGITVHFRDVSFKVETVYTFGFDVEYKITGKSASSGAVLVSGPSTESYQLTVNVISSGGRGEGSFVLFKNDEKLEEEHLIPLDGEFKMTNGLTVKFDGVFTAGDTFIADVTAQEQQIVDPTTMIVVLIAVVVLGIIGAAAVVMSRHKSGRRDYEIMR